MTFNQQLAAGGAEMIAALYNGTLKPTINEPGTDTQVYVQTLDQRTYVIFPGTDGIQDWRTDFKAIKTSWMDDRGAVHRGFAAAWSSVMSEVLKETQNAAQVIVIGHSLGGALAMLAASFIQSAQGNIAGVYTYGQPRVGNGAFKRAYNATLNAATFRIVNEEDPVPYLPPWLMGYRHTGREVFLTKNGFIQVERGLFSELQTSARAAWRGYETKGASAFASISAHHIASYVKKLNEGTIA
jgi:hypothetical protein